MIASAGADVCLLFNTKYSSVPNGGPKSRNLQGKSHLCTLQAFTQLQQFGLYILFPIGIMYYFGTNLDQKFSVPGFWPGPNQTHKIPFEKEEIDAELARLKARRLQLRRKRLEEE